MGNFSFTLTGRNKDSKEKVFKLSIQEWHELLFTLCPSFADGTAKFKFDRESVLSPEEMELLDKITYDEDAFDRIKHSLNLAKENSMEIAITITDY